MKVFKSNKNNFLYFIYRLISPLFDPIKFYLGLKGYIWFMRDALKYISLDKKAKIFSMNIYPKLEDKTSFSQIDAHYFYHPLWVFEHLFKIRPKEHVDIGSSYLFCGYLSKITKVTYVDIRPFNTLIKNLIVKSGSVLNLPFKDNSIRSLSCLHVAEHIGLGRYGDPIDPSGTEKACMEISRVLSKKGFLYFCLPTGIDRLCFNAHRIISPRLILKYFKDLELIEFAVVDDEGNFINKADITKYNNLNYGCGMYLFTKK